MQERIIMKEKSTRQSDEAEIAMVYDTSLNTHGRINAAYSGEIEFLEKGYAKISLETKQIMRVDDDGLIHGGFIFSAADYAAMAAVNEPNVLLTSCSCLYTAPVRVGDVIVFEAKEYRNDGRVRSISVHGFVNGIKVFEGTFKAVVTERHVLRLDLIKKIEKHD